MSCGGSVKNRAGGREEIVSVIEIHNNRDTGEGMKLKREVICVGF